MPSVEQLRSRVQKEVAQLQDGDGAKRQKQSICGTITVRNIVGEARSMHSEPFHTRLGENPSSKNFPPENYYIFQAASQFNLLEFPSPSVTPEAGIEDYVYDRTQGPACAVACAAGTAYRNYLVPIMKAESSDNKKNDNPTIQQRGQTEDCQLNGLHLVEDYLNTSTTLQQVPWIVCNGYIEGKKRDILQLNTLLESDSLLEDALVRNLQIGVQEDTTVTDCGGQVTQTYNSAISIGYSHLPDHLWEPMAKIVLQATYEGTLLVAISKAMELQDKTVTVLLTKVGGGVFRNDDSWICVAMAKAIHQVETLVTKPCGIGLDIRIVHFGDIQEEYRILERWKTRMFFGKQ